MKNLITLFLVCFAIVIATAFLCCPAEGAEAINLGTGNSAINLVGGYTDKVANWDFTSGWSTSNATINSATQFTANSGGYGASIYKTYLTIGAKYKVSVAGTVSAGGVRIWDATSGGVWGEVSGTFSVSYNVTAKSTSLYLTPSTNGAVVTITSMTIYPENYILMGN